MFLEKTLCANTTITRSNIHQSYLKCLAYHALSWFGKQKQAYQIRYMQRQSNLTTVKEKHASQKEYNENSRTVILNRGARLPRGSK